MILKPQHPRHSTSFQLVLCIIWKHIWYYICFNYTFFNLNCDYLFVCCHLMQSELW